MHSQLLYRASAYIVERRQYREVVYNVLGRRLKGKGEYSSHLLV